MLLTSSEEIKKYEESVEKCIDEFLEEGQSENENKRIGELIHESMESLLLHANDNQANDLMARFLQNIPCGVEQKSSFLEDALELFAVHENSDVIEPAFEEDLVENDDLSKVVSAEEDPTLFFCSSKVILRNGNFVDPEIRESHELGQANIVDDSCNDYVDDNFSVDEEGGFVPSWGTSSVFEKNNSRKSMVIEKFNEQIQAFATVVDGNEPGVPKSRFEYMKMIVEESNL